MQLAGTPHSGRFAETIWHLAAPLLVQLIRGSDSGPSAWTINLLKVLLSLDDVNGLTQYFDCRFVVGHDFHLLSFSESTTLLAKAVRKNRWNNSDQFFVSKYGCDIGLCPHVGQASFPGKACGRGNANQVSSHQVLQPQFEREAP